MVKIAQLDSAVKGSSKIDSFVEAIFAVEILKLPVLHDHLQLFSNVLCFESPCPLQQPAAEEFSHNFVIDLTCGFEEPFFTPLLTSSLLYIQVVSSL